MKNVARASLHQFNVVMEVFIYKRKRSVKTVEGGRSECEKSLRRIISLKGN